MATETTAIENTEDTLDVRDIMARYEFLEARSGGIDDALDDGLTLELIDELMLELILDDPIVATSTGPTIAATTIARQPDRNGTPVAPAL